MMSIEPQWVVVTGAGRGIGREIALNLARQGFYLELCDRDAGTLAETCQLIGSQTAFESAAFDLTDRSALDGWCRDVAGRRVTLRALVHNAGIGGPDPADLPGMLTHLDHVLEVNTTAPFRISRRLFPLLPTDGRGRVVVIASILGRMGVAGFSAYCASKAALIGLCRAMALDLAPRRITVNCVCPGWTDTHMAQQGFEAIASANGWSSDDARRNVEAGLPLGRIVKPEEVAGLVAFLLSESAGSMTGQSILMCGGDQQR